MPKLKKIFFPLLLVLITVSICFLNYTPNTFLTGWDTLHPEFNFSLNFQRLLNIWHPELGLGAISAHADMSELPRVLILWLFHFVLPLNFLRYSYIFLCFIIGPLGIYFLIKFIFQKSTHQNLIAFLVSLLYIFNLSTLQQFYVPLEMFTTQWAFLPWIIFFSLKYLQDNRQKNLILFSIFTILATPQAWAPQLWYAFFAVYTLFLIIYSYFNKNQTKKSIKLIIFTLLLNTFWLLPNIFYIITSSSTPQLNRDNRLYSQEFLLKNRQNGTLTDSTIIKGFYFDWSVFNFKKENYDNLMPKWNSQINNPAISAIGYAVFILSLLGLIISFLKKDKLFMSLSPFFIVPFVLLSNKVIIFSQIFDFLIQNSTIRESFRFIFTKTSILFLFGLIIFFAYFIEFLFQKIKSLKLINISSVFIIIALVVYAFPIFQGQLISPAVRVNIPNEYFQMWQFMESQNYGRVLSLPLNQSAGWQYYNWGYQGSGFLWFNLNQSLLDRDSDRWSNQNEQSYTEFFNSLYSQESQHFSQTLNKYKIKYIIWDQNVINPSSKNSEQIIFRDQIKNLLDQLEKQNLIKKINQFASISIYQTNLLTAPKDTKIITNFVSPTYKWGYFDAADLTDYVTTNSNNIYYPFRDLLDKFQKINTNKLDILQLSTDKWQINLKTQNQPLQIPKITDTETIIPTNVYLDKNILKFEFPLPAELQSSFKTEFPISSSNININDQNQPGIINISTNSENFLNQKSINFNFNQQPITSLDQISINSTSLNFNNPKYFKNTNNDQNYTIQLPTLAHSFGYIIAIKSQYFSGIPLRFCLRNNYSFLCSIEDELNKNKKSSWDYFLIPSTGKDFGYELSLTNISFGGQTSESIIDQISIIPIPFNFLSQIKSETKNIPPQNFLIYNQTYSPFWIAFYFDNYKPIILKNHSLSNNWANSWPIPQNIDPSKIHVIFWPQIFEFLGLALIPVVFILILKKSK